MSLILDALNRSRQDTEQMPGLASSHYAEPAPHASNWVQWLLVAALALAVLAVGWLLYDRVQSASPAESAATDVPASVPPLPIAPAPSPAPVPEPKKAAETPVALTATAPAGLSSAPAAPEVQPLPLPREEPSRAPVDASVAALYEQREPLAALPPSPAPAPARAGEQAAPEAVVREEEALDIEQLVARAQAELKDASLAEHEVPLLATLSQQTKDGIPTLMYQRHDYSGVAGQSSVLINGKTLRVGMSVGGVKVEEILPDSVVLNANGTRFRLRALNSWVNL